jgi:hypothetical protein
MIRKCVDASPTGEPRIYAGCLREDGLVSRHRPERFYPMKETGGDHETRFAMTFKSWISRLAAPLIALILTVAPLGSPVHAVEGARKVSVVS